MNVSKWKTVLSST